MPLSPLQRFLDFAQRLCASTSLDSVAVGMVYTSEAAPRVLALRAEITGSDAHQLEAFSADGIGALRVVKPIGWLSGFIDEIERDRKASIDDLTLDIPVENWSYLDEHGGHPERSARVYSALPRLDNLFDQEALRSMDRAIAKNSGYRVPSLIRLVARYLGPLRLADRFTADVELLAPWPISGLAAMLEGKALRLEIRALNAAARGRFIINIETDSEGDRLDLDAMQWTQVKDESSGRATHVGVVDEPPITPRAVNVYYDGLDEVWLREPVKEGDEGRLHAPARPASRPVPTLASDAERSLDSGAAITKLHVENFRGLRWVTLELTPLTVLVGPNQAGKSSVLDTLDILARAARGELYDAITRRRGGFKQIVWRGEGSGFIQLAVDVSTTGGQLFQYRVVLGPVGMNDYAVESEHIFQRGDDGKLRLRLDVKSGAVDIGGQRYRSKDGHELFLAQHRSVPGMPELELIRSTLSSMAVYPYFATGASWASLQAPSMRAPTRPEPGARLSATGDNLAAALHSMREESPGTWEIFLDIVKLAFPHCKDIRLPTPALSHLQLVWYDTRFDQPFDASMLSDGTLAYLASLCALLQAGGPLVALDEPESHLHPDALYRLIGAARMVSDQRTVLLTTQSDRILDFVDDLPESVVVARATDQGTELVRPDKEDLERWLEEFSLADMRHELETWGEE